MGNISITKIFSFEMAHALLCYDGACANIHGHSYKMEVSIGGVPLNEDNHPKNGMIMDFGELKALVQEEILAQIDHALVLHHQTPSDLVSKLKEHYKNIVLVSYQPTSENMLQDFAQRIQAKLKSGIMLQKIKLYETANSFAEWTA